MDIFKERIDPAIQASGKSDRAIEQALGLTRGTISKWRKTQLKSYMDCFVDLAKCLGVSAAYLLGETDEKSPSPAVDSPKTEEQALFDQLDAADKEFIKDWMKKRVGLS